MKERSNPVSSRRRLLLCGLLLSLFAVSCGTPSGGSRQRSDPPTATAAVTQMPSPPAVSSSAAAPDRVIDATASAFRSDAAEIGEIVWTAAIDPETKAPLEPVSTFSIETPTLYAVFPVARIRQETTITASWTYNDTTMPTLDSTIAVPSDAEAIWIEFHLTLTAGATWPPGAYEIAIAINGEPATRAMVEVVE
jgi:hypothetical protein